MTSIVWLLIVIAANAELICGSALTKSIHENKERVESTKLCVDNEQRQGSLAHVQAVLSENCNHHACLASIKALEARDLHETNSFRLCLKVGGEPESIKIQMDALGAGVWHTTDRCRFDLDFSYLDLTTFRGEGPFKLQ